MIVLAVDPGLDGAMAWLDTDNPTWVRLRPMPTLKITKNSTSRRVVDLPTLVTVLNPSYAHVCVLETLGTRPAQSTAGAATSGRGWGLVEAICFLHRIPLQTVQPQVWKRAFGLLSKGKNASVVYVQRRWPGVDLGPASLANNKADAILIGQWLIEKGDLQK